METRKIAFKPNEVADLLGVSPKFVRRLLQKGEMHSVKAGSKWLIPVESLEQFLRGDSQQIK